VISVAAGERPAFKPLRLDGNAVRWQPPVKGDALVVSYSFVKSEVAFPGARNCRKITPLDSLLSASRIPTAVARAEIAAAFAMWETVANIDFREAPTLVEADILIGAQAEPEGWAFADVFYNASSPEPIKPISRALICLNPDRTWKVGFDGDLHRYDVRYTIAHEIGHAIGLDHPSGPGQIMGYRYLEGFRELQAGDIAGAVVLYGERQPIEAVSPSGPSSVSTQRTPATRLGGKQLGTRAFTAPLP
jgi:hypothetical protein